MLCENRKFYDLCRKYKYYYRAYLEVEKLKDIYWSKYIQESYKEVEEKIKNIEKEMIFLIFDEYLGKEFKVTSKKERKDIGCEWHYEMEINELNGNFMKLMDEYMKKRKLNYNSILGIGIL